MSKRLAPSLGIGFFAGLLAFLAGWRDGLPGTLRTQAPPAHAAPPAAAAPPAQQVAHPLDPLSKEELAAAVQVLKADGRLAQGALFPTVVLNEPPKEAVLGFSPGDPIRREAFAVVLDRGANKTHEAVVDLGARKVVSWTEVRGVQPAVLLLEPDLAAELVRADARWQAAMRRRGITDFTRVYLEAWAPGHPPPAGAPEGTRLLRVISYYRGDATHPYGRPIEGVVALVNLRTEKVHDVQDAGVVPIPKDASDFFDPRAIGPLRRPAKPLVISQPGGASFEVRGHEVRWERWRFRFALHPREGLVLYTVGYEDGGRVRPILYRASLSEMMVPYGDGSDTWAWRSPFDEGEYGLGRLASPLRRGREVPPGAVLFDAAFADDEGTPYDWPRSVALYEQDGGLLWTHTEFGKNRSETRRARQLVVASIATLGNYDYGLNWVFGQDGALELRVDLMGIVLVKAVAAATCPVCRQRPGEDGKVRPEGEDRFGTLVAKNLVATNHQHFFCFRLDLDVDGPRNSVEELNVVPAPPGKDNPHRNAFTQERTRFRTEQEARRDLNLSTHRTWKVLNPNRRSDLGHFPAYLLEPGGNALPLLPPESAPRRRAGFLDHPVWVTRHRPAEQHAAGPYPNQGRGGDGLPRWVRANEAVENQDVVLWYTFGVTHVPRVEEWPVMPAVKAGFRLVPDGFFTRNPALDVPPPEAP